MAENIRINLDTSQYAAPTADDIRAAKQFILRRDDFARILGDRVDECVEKAAGEIVSICFKYDVDPFTFEISGEFNEDMMEEIAAVMDALEEEILDLIYEYSTRATDNRSRIASLTAWMMTLGRGNRNLRDTLDAYLYKFLRDIEAAVAAMKSTETTAADAVTKIRTHLHSVYTMPDIMAAFRHAEDFNAEYIRNRGVTKGGAGLSNNGSTNVVKMARITLDMAWMRSQAMDFMEDGAVGVYVLRGSSYPCVSCDENCGFHPIKESYGVLPVHPNCQCFAVPIYAKGNGNLSF